MVGMSMEESNWAEQRSLMSDSLGNRSRRHGGPHGASIVVRVLALYANLYVPSRRVFVKT